jgi:hypothetical protein
MMRLSFAAAAVARALKAAQRFRVLFKKLREV